MRLVGPRNTFSSHLSFLHFCPLIFICLLFITNKMADIKNEEIIQNDNASAVEANLKGVSEHPLAPGTEKRIAVEKKLKRKLDAR